MLVLLVVKLLHYKFPIWLPCRALVFSISTFLPAAIAQPAKQHTSQTDDHES